MNYRILLCLLFNLPLIGFSQGEFNHWCFGTYKHISFNSGFPVLMPNTALNTNGSTISVSDSAGNLLFYSEGKKVYNRNNTLMPNGSGLGGSTVSMSSSVTVVKAVDDDSIYYIMTGGYHHLNPLFITHAEYSVLDMKLNGTMGDIVAGQKNIPFIGGYSAYGPVTGVRHANNRDAWIVYRLASSDSNYFAVYAITHGGVNTIPVFSPSQIHGETGAPKAIQIKISPDGKTLACSYTYSSYNDSLEICDFDPATGQVTPRFLTRPRYNGMPLTFRQVEFSTDSRLIYLGGSTDPNHWWMFQYENTPDSAQFSQSQLVIGSTGQIHSTYQMAPDWKIYGTKDAEDSLMVVNDPSVRGAGCGFDINGFYTGWNHADGLPQFVQRYKAYIHFTGNCQDMGVQFSGDIWPPADSIHWDFGDPGSAGSNVSLLPSPQHVFSDTGIYTVTLFVRHNDLRTDTSWQTIHILLSPFVDLGPDKTVCNGDTASFDAGSCSGCNFIWKDVIADTVTSTSQIFRTIHPGVYSVRAIQQNGCEGRDTVQVFNTATPVLITTPLYDTICSGDTTEIFLTSSVPGAIFHWTPVLTSGSITGFSADSGLVIRQVLVNQISQTGIVNYTITPSVGNCLGSPVDYPVTVYQKDSVKVDISVSANDVCTGSPVTFTATPFNPGLLPAYLWLVNGLPAGSNSPGFSFTPANGDLVYCILTSSITRCILNNPDTSNTIIMIVHPPSVPAGVTVTASPNPFCPGVAVTFTATPVNGGTSPFFQWKVNNVNSGTNSPVFIYNPSINDTVWCIMTSDLFCVSGNPALSNRIVMGNSLAPAVTFTPCFDTITTTNAKPFKLKGGLPLGGTYTGPGVNSTTGIFTPSSAGAGTKTITYSFTNAALCSGSNTAHIIVRSIPAFICGNNLTDIRDNMVYPTILIGSQCWMAAELNYGEEIPATRHQRDNCINEKYVNRSSVVNPPSSVYQWDELMRYEDIPGQQGLCPPGWHIPAETEWNTLFSNWTNSAFAGAPLKYSGYSGFNALMRGVSHQNVQWDYHDIATFFWSSTSHGINKSWAHGMNDYDFGVSLYPSLRSNAFSVRCLKD